MQTLPQQLELPLGIPVCCDYCLRDTFNPQYVSKHIGRSTTVKAFCGESCANEFYLEHLRGAGL